MSEDIRSRIIAGEFPTGHRLPSERELGEQYGLGRASVREALRALEAQGLVHTIQGRGGGSVVKVPAADSIEQSIELFMHGQQINFDTVIETREFIEPIVARLAARRREDSDLYELGRTHALLQANEDRPENFLEANVAWHLAVAHASHNPLLIAFMSAISRAVHRGTTAEGFNSLETRRATIRAHEKIVEAIVKRDEDAACRRMERHVFAYAETAEQLSVPTPS
ncbi:FadR/GntR family transcriptional regulator [Sphingobium sp. TomTYG45]